MLIIFEYKFNKIDKQVFPKLKGYTYVPPPKAFHSTLIGETKDFPHKFNIVKNLNLSSFL